MERFENNEYHQALSKQLTFNAVTQLLAEYVDQRYHFLKKESLIDFRITSNIDYMMLPLLKEDECFTLWSFLKRHFNDDQVVMNKFFDLINKIRVFDDLLELLIILNIYNRQNNWDKDLKQQRLKLCLSYYSQLKKVNDLHSVCLKLIFCLQKEQLKLRPVFYGGYTNKKEMVETLEEVEIMQKKINGFQIKTDSKKNLVECLDLLFKYSTITIGNA